MNIRFPPDLKSVVMLLFLILILMCFFPVGQKLILVFWGRIAASPLNILHGGFGVGSFIVPLIANPFLAVPDNAAGRQNGSMTTNNTDVYDLGTTSSEVMTSVVETTSRTSSINQIQLLPDSSLLRLGNMGNITSNHNLTHITGETRYIKESRIEYAYLISAVITLMLSLVFYFYHFKGKRLQNEHKSDNIGNKRTQFPKRCKTMINPATCADGRFVYGLELFVVLFIYFFNIVGGERILGKFIRAYAIEQLDFSVSDGSYVNTGFWISFALGRLFGFIVARFLPIRKLVLIETGGLMITTILLNIFAVDSSLGLWILVLPLGMFHSPCFPSMVGWADYHVRMTGMAITLLLLGGSLGGVAYLKITGYLFESHGARAFLYHLLAFGIAAFILAIVLDVIGAQHGSRFDKPPEAMEPEKNTDTDSDMEQDISPFQNETEQSDMTIPMCEIDK